MTSKHDPLGLADLYPVDADIDGDYPAGSFYVSARDGYVNVYRYPSDLALSVPSFEVDDLIAALATAARAAEADG